MAILGSFELFYHVHPVLSGEQSHARLLLPPEARSRAHACSRHRSCALRPCTPDVHLLACIHVHARPSLAHPPTSLVPARAHPRVCARPPLLPLSLAYLHPCRTCARRRTPTSAS
ncbi:hypothetical protein CRG98_005121 [Punica granatum]|uniref:Uncharacterized protein n=1 Tax=Punica granatum TaxID=22663 RepID=A0A2I0L1B5_PUNGR|nr:hypothetical protein CRG98_005121 [Punica granatum]